MILSSSVWFIYVVFGLAEAAVLFVLLEEQLMSKKKSVEEPGLVMMLLRIIVIAGTAITLALLPVWISKPDWKQADPYSLLNAGVSALAFAAVIQSLWYQQHQLKLQRNELKLQRIDLRKSVVEYEKMADAQKSSDKRLFLTAYVTALNTIRELNLHPPITDTNRPQTIFSAVRQRAIHRHLDNLIAPLSVEAVTLFGLKKEDEPKQHVLELLAAAAEPLSDLFLRQANLRNLNVRRITSIVEDIQLSCNTAELFADTKGEFDGVQLQCKAVLQMMSEGRSETDVLQMLYSLRNQVFEHLEAYLR